MLTDISRKAVVLYLVMAFIGIYANSVSAQILSGKIKRGIENYNREKYDEALKVFIDAQIEAPEDAQLSYNIGNAYYKMKNYDEAVRSFLNTAAKTKDVKLEEKSYYNLGNSFYRQGKLQEAAAFYQKALELDAKRNLEFVREEIKRHINQEKERQQQDQQEQEQQEQEQNQEQQPDSDQQAQGEQDQEKQEQQDQQSQQDQQGQEDQQHQSQQPPGEQEDKQDGEKHPQQAGTEGEKGQEEHQTQAAQAAEPMSDEDAQRWLNSLTEDKREFLKRQMKNLPGRGHALGKDW